MKKNLRLIFAGWLIQFTTMAFGRFVFTLILPDMMKTLGLSATMMGFLGTGIVAGYLINSFISGKIAGVIGEEKTLKYSITLVSGSLFCLGYFSSYPVLLAATLGLGAGAAGSYIPLIAILNRSVSKKGSAFGIVMGGAGAGIVLSGYIVPPLLTVAPGLGYRMSWYVLSIINTFILLVAFWLLKQGREKISRQRAKTEKKIISRVFTIQKKLFLTVLFYFILGFSYIIYVTYFGAYAIAEIGFSEKTVGIMWSLFGFNSLYSGLFWGWFSDRVNKIIIVMSATSILTGAVFIIIPCSVEWVFYLSTFLFGFVFVGLITVTASLISDEVKEREMGKVFGAATLIHGMGQVCGTPLAGYLRDVASTWRLPFSVSALSLAISVMILMRLKCLSYPGAER
jgi:MFS family permease